ncbi:unnamed protein product [Chrysodeixis includens]|uniref:Cuticle protein n=1 Tax=Chrysodeixis includens TaxID=689277 RepID=A0A9P0FQ30_CHRIL|nr:unnamed protein product [Chrysodeixis includens]
MNSLVVFLSVVALVAGKPSGLLYGGAVAYSAPAVLAPAGIAPAIIPPAVYSAPAITTLPAAVSSQSRIDIKSTPAITSTLISAPLAYGDYSTHLYAGAVAPAYLKAAYVAPAVTSYAAIPAATAIAAPAAAPAVPEDTPEVVAARAAHFEAKALAEHSIQKRSAPFSHLATPLITSYAAAPIVHAAPLAYSAPVAYSTPLITKAYGGYAF